jgi:hypothetical protein
MTEHTALRHTAPQWLVAILLSLCAIAPTHAADKPELPGLWMETNNYPASSVIRFERSGNQLLGRYAQVSAMQQMWGFKVGEVVIRGAIRGDKFNGEVLLKVSPGTPDECRAVEAYWAPIKMQLIDRDKLYGAWLQTYVDKDKKCVVVGEKWQIYGLGKC